MAGVRKQHWKICYHVPGAVAIFPRTKFTRTDRMLTHDGETPKNICAHEVCWGFSSFFAVAISSHRSLLVAHKLSSESESNTNTIRQANRNRARIQIHTHTAWLLRLQINRRHIYHSRLILFSGYDSVPYVFLKFDLERAKEMHGRVASE